MLEKLTPESQPMAAQAEPLHEADPTVTAEATASANSAVTGGSAAAAGRAVKGASDGPEAAPAAKPAGAAGQLGQWQEFGKRNAWIHDALRQTPSWLVSMVVHMVLLLVLALLTLPEAVTDEVRQLVIAPDQIEQLDDLKELDYEPPKNIDVSAQVSAVETEVEQPDVEISPAEDVDAAAVAVELDDFGVERAPRNDLLATVGAYTGDGLSGRGAKERAGLAQKYGGTPASEQAVAAALKWLAEHQFYDGGWSFNHARAPRCGGQCRNPGQLEEARIAATAMALLPFLGAGQTHKTGNYKTTVKNGLYFLVTKMKRTPQGGNLWEPGGRMYSHGLASIALCEAYAMTHDKGLHQPAQEAINFICYAQDPIGGGWRYDPRERGDTSVVGWQIMALKSGYLAYLRVPPITAKKAFQFLDSVQAESGASYGYLDGNIEPGTGQATTAIGLLCRMYLGWKKDNAALQQGVEWISSIGPSVGDMYYNYYATQVMRHWEGDLWKKWNDVMRDQLVNSQAKGGHEAGSWFMPGGDLGADQGGRLYCTSMATMILEVYYRYMPIYRKQSTEENFPE
jgi:hypothetical protein